MAISAGALERTHLEGHTASHLVAKLMAIFPQAKEFLPLDHHGN